MTDLLRMDYINSLSQPFTVRVIGGGEYEVYDIDIETGLFRMIVCGMLEVRHISDTSWFMDMDGIKHDPDSFYSDYED